MEPASDAGQHLDGPAQRIHDFIASLSPWDLMYLRKQTQTSDYSRRIMLSSVDALPQALVAEIFCNLSMADLFSCLQVSKAWRHAWTAPAVLKNALARLYPDLHISPQQETDFAAFKRAYTDYAERFLNPSSNLRSITFWTCQKPADPSQRMRVRLNKLPPLVYHEGMFAWQPEPSYVLIQDIDASCTYKCTYGKKTAEGTTMHLVGVSKHLLIFTANSREFHIWHIRLDEWKQVNLPAKYALCAASRTTLVIMAVNKAAYKWSWETKLEELPIDHKRLKSLSSDFYPILGGFPAAIINHESRTTTLIWTFQSLMFGDHLYSFIAGTYEPGAEPTYTQFSFEHNLELDAWRDCASILICEPRKLNKNGTYVIATVNQEMAHFIDGVASCHTSRYVCYNAHTGRFMCLDGDLVADSPDAIYRLFGGCGPENAAAAEGEPTGRSWGRSGPSNGSHLSLKGFGLGESRRPEHRNRVAFWSNVRLFREESLTYWAGGSSPQQVRAGPLFKDGELPASNVFAGQEAHSSGCDLDEILALPEPYSTLALTYRLHYPAMGSCHEAVFMDETGIVIAGNNSFVTSRWPTPDERSGGRQGGYLGKALWEANDDTANDADESDIMTDYNFYDSGQFKDPSGRVINATERYAKSLRQVGWLEAILNQPVVLGDAPPHLCWGSAPKIDFNVLGRGRRSRSGHVQILRDTDADDDQIGDDTASEMAFDSDEALEEME